MQLTNAPSKIVLPFANSGSKNTIPASSQIGITAGAASLTDGFPPLTRTPIASGGVPPSGLDMNGILYQLSAITRWASAGAGYTYDSTFASDANVGGYPQGARVLRADGTGYWLNTVDANTTNPETGGAGWVPDYTYGAAAVTMTSSNVTLTAAQYGKQVIVLTGTLTANLQLIFPAIVGRWAVINSTTGAYTITCKTASGTGPVVSGVREVVGDGTNIQLVSSQSTQLQSISASVGSNALTISYAGDTLDFRSATLTTGAPVRVAVNALSITIPTGATLGSTSGVASRLVSLVAYNAGSPVLCVANLAGGAQLDETNLISPTTISASATSAGVIYSASAVAAGSPYRVIGFVDNTQATAGTWATAPTLVQGAGGQALAAMSSIGYGQTLQAVTRVLGTTYYNTTGKPIFCIGSFFSLANNVTGSVMLSINGGAGVLVGQCGGSAVNQSTGNFSVLIPAGASYRFDSGSANNFAVSEIR